MGLTSRAKMIPGEGGRGDLGQLTDAMRVEDGGTISLKSYVHPRVEPEVAFLLKRPLSGAVSPAEAVTAIAAVAPAMEIIDSRYENFKFTLPDVVADNASSSGFVLGGVERAGRRPLQPRHDHGVRRPSGADRLDRRHPRRPDPLAGLGRPHGRQGRVPLEAGWVVMAGAATAAQPLVPGVHVRNTVEGLGMASFFVAAA